jgi:diaminopimelate epimerase
MGELRTAWQEIPLAREMDTLHLELACGPLSDPVAVNIGNPHAVFFVADAAAVDLETLGPQLEHDPLFPERANIGVAELMGPDCLRVRVWERGVGLTRACGTGACAAAAAAHRRGLTGRKAEVRLDGGPLALEWREDGHMVMSGPVATSFTGVFARSLLPLLPRPS